MCLSDSAAERKPEMSTDRLGTLLDEYAELERRLADPAIHADQAAARRGRPALRRADPDPQDRRRA